jgi:WD40 repeat protein
LLLLAGESRAQEVDENGLYRQPFLVLDPSMHTAPIRKIDVDAAARYIVTGSLDKTVRVWSVTDGQILRTIRLASGPDDLGIAHSIAIAPDGNTIAVGTWMQMGAHYIFLFDRATGRQIGRIGPLLRNAITLAFSHDGGRLAAAIGGRFSSSWSVNLFDVQTRQQIAFDDAYGGQSQGITFDRTGRIATTSFDGKIRLYGPNLERRLVVAAPGGPEPFGIAFSPDNRHLAIGYSNQGRVDVLNGQNLRAEFKPNTRDSRAARLIHVAWSRDGSILYAAGIALDGLGRNLVLAWKDKGRGSLQISPVASNTISGVRALSDGRLVVASHTPNLTLLDRTLSVLWQAAGPGADFRDQEDTFKVSADGRQVLFRLRYSGSDILFDLNNRTLAPAEAPIAGLVPAETKTLPITDWLHSHPKLDGQPLAIPHHEISRSLAIMHDRHGFWLGTDWSLRYFDVKGTLIRTIPVPAVAFAINVTADHKLLVAALDDGTIRWYRISDGVQVLSFYAHSNGKHWVAWTPLGHYVASPGAEDLIQWQINRGLDEEALAFSAARFRDQFYRPDVIERVLDTLDPQKAVEAADGVAGRLTVLKSITDDTPPRVAILDPAHQTLVEKTELVVAYTVEDRPGTMIRRIRLLHGPRVVAEERNRQLPPEGRMIGEFRIKLEGEDRTLILFAESERGSSDPASVTIRRNPTGDEHKPNLYVLAIGVAEYKKHPSIKLQFAKNDADAFVERARRQEGGLYNRVEVRSLTNEQATRRAVLEGLAWLERNMSTRDVAAVFFSSHGANDATGDLYLLPHDVEVEDEIGLRHSGVPYSQLRGTLIRLAERGKTLLFLDACHSGNVLSGVKSGLPDMDKVASDLASHENGVVVFSSSTAKQFSIELPEYGHGAFTAALLEAFDGSSDRPPPLLRVSDLEIWLKSRVKQLTKGAQTPTVTVPGERWINPYVFRMQPTHSR